MATLPPDSLYPSLTADLIRRQPDLDIAEDLADTPRANLLSENVRFFVLSWAGGFVFFLTLFG